VKALAAAGADLAAKDTAYDGTPLGWARHYESETQDPTAKARYAAIARFLGDSMHA
jgi:peptide-methionine (S)-S-oxide reductase